MTLHVPEFLLQVFAYSANRAYLPRSLVTTDYTDTLYVSRLITHGNVLQIMIRCGVQCHRA